MTHKQFRCPECGEWKHLPSCPRHRDNWAESGWNPWRHSQNTLVHTPLPGCPPDLTEMAPGPM